MNKYLQFPAAPKNNFKAQNKSKIKEMLDVHILKPKLFAQPKIQASNAQISKSPNCLRGATNESVSPLPKRLHVANFQSNLEEPPSKQHTDELPDFNPQKRAATLKQKQHQLGLKLKSMMGSKNIHFTSNRKRKTEVVSSSQKILIQKNIRKCFLHQLSDLPYKFDPAHTGDHQQETNQSHSGQQQKSNSHI